jgi:hypothetical protein
MEPSSHAMLPVYPFVKVNPAIRVPDWFAYSPRTAAGPKPPVPPSGDPTMNVPAGPALEISVSGFSMQTRLVVVLYSSVAARPP